jgi:hypothetical protein
MKHFLLTMIVLFSVAVAQAQDVVEVSFTASTETGLYCPFTSVSATNVTRGWTETLVYPDTILVLTNTVGVNEQEEKAFYLGNAFPNPFTGETFAFLELPEKSDVALQVVRVDGSEVAIQRLSLDAGTYRLKVSLSSPNMAFLSVTTNYGRQVVKLVHTGHGTKDALDVDFVSTMTKSLDAASSLKLDVTGEFEPGDVMRYEAQLIDGGATIYSAPVTQSQYDDETITLLFALAMPTVTTNGVTDITQTTATCGGNVADGGGLMVIARGVCWSTMPDPTVNDSHTSDGTGVGGFTSNITGLIAGTPYYVRAYAVNRLGTSYGNEVDFTASAPPQVPIGAINGLFTVGGSKRVYFSQGNLQYQASTNTWRFAENQWDYVGNNNNGTVYENEIQSNNDSISSSYDGWIDLYRWGTSSYNHGAICYQPWSISETNSDYYAYGIWNLGLYSNSGQADWGYNAISNGGNLENSGWRTLTQLEWDFVFNSRYTESGVRFARGIVNGVNGVLLLPDDWNSSIYSLNCTNDENSVYMSNQISSTDWFGVLEPNGVVFLPASYPFLDSYNSYGHYWSSTPKSIDNVYLVSFKEGVYIDQDGYKYRSSKSAVRLVQDYQP